MLEIEGVAGKDKLKKLIVDVGSGDPLHIVTNAVQNSQKVLYTVTFYSKYTTTLTFENSWGQPNVVEGCLCVVATVGKSRFRSCSDGSGW